MSVSACFQHPDTGVSVIVRWDPANNRGRISIELANELDMTDLARYSSEEAASLKALEARSVEWPELTSRRFSDQKMAEEAMEAEFRRCGLSRFEVDWSE